MKITSPVFTSNDMIPTKYTCQGEDVNPPLDIFDPPVETKSFALIVSDEDSPNGDYVHWLVWNIDPATWQIEEGGIPDGSVEGMNEFGKSGWDGPCPPSGIHQYKFHLYALDSIIDLPATSNKDDLREKIKSHIIKEATLIGLYERMS